MWKYTFIIVLNLSFVVLTFGDDYGDDDYTAEVESVKITDVLKMIVLPPAHEIKSILTGNSTKLQDSSRLDFILQAIEYWRKHNMEENIEEQLGNDNSTKFTFNLRDDFLDDHTTSNSHLSKKTQKNADSTGKAKPLIRNLRTRRSKNDQLTRLPYIYVKNLYSSDKVYRNNMPRNSTIMRN